MWGRNCLFWLTVCRDSPTWWRKRDGRTARHAASLIRKQRNLNVDDEIVFLLPPPFPLLFSIRVQIVKWWCLHLGWVFPLYPVKPLWKHPHRQAQNYIPYMMLNAVKLIIKVNHRISYVSSENIFLLWRMRKARSLFFLLLFPSSFPSTTFSSFWILSVTTLVTIFILIGTKF